ncbi:unnamed protein product [Brassica oleracea var. botrytis]|uniref:(rape) hypothetical protein n=1 Tax=Brassica napus TaxID=3708 RepID=A0A816IWR0_BRANA|nr:unnamed protein product [Brassica napus]
MAMTVAASTSVAVSPPSLTFLRYLLALLRFSDALPKVMKLLRYSLAVLIWSTVQHVVILLSAIFFLSYGVAFCKYQYSVKLWNHLILAFPCNQGTTDPITDFVCTRFKSEFPIFHKVQTARRILYKFYVLSEVLKQQNLPPLCFRLK